MIKASQAYKDAIVADSRRIYFKAESDIIDPDLEFGDTVVTSNAYYSQIDQLNDRIYELARYKTLEHNRWVLDGSLNFPQEINGEFGYVGDVLSDENGYFATPQVIEQKIVNTNILQTFSIYFSDNENDGVASDFVVELESGGTVYYKWEYTGNTKSVLVFSDLIVYYPDLIRITITKWSLPSCRIRLAEILPGVSYVWTGRDFAGIEIKHQADISNLTIPYGTCTLTLDNSSREFEPRNKSGIFQSIEERQKITVSMGVLLDGDTVEYKPLGTYYQYSNGWRTSDNGITIQWSLVDIIGLLANRVYIKPETLPTTLDGWLKSIVSQLGTNFSDRYSVDPAYADKPLTVRLATDVDGMTCGDLIRNVCMAAGVWARADAETGYLTAEPLWNQGNKLTLSNLVNYPTMAANEDIAAIIFTLNDNGQSEYVVSGNTTAASQTQSIKNPFIKTQEQALQAARLILETAGGNKVETVGRGDMTSEVGDVDTVWIDDSQAITARRIEQSFDFSNGVLVNSPSKLLQADGSTLFQTREKITKSGSWTAPAGVNKIRFILVGGGNRGADGSDGGWGKTGAHGENGWGAFVYSDVININNMQTFSVTIGAGSEDATQNGGDTTFGMYSTANGERYEFGYTDIASGDSFARSGVKNPLPNSGDGGVGGKGGRAGRSRQVTDANGESYTRVDVTPGSGKPGTNGASGCVVIYYDKVV